jgi:hypothetical protein
MSLVEATCHSLFFFFYLIFFLTLHSPPTPPLFTIATIPTGQPHRSLTLMPSPPLHPDRYAFACMCHPPCHTRVPNWPAPWRTQPCGGRSPAIVPLRVVLPDPAPPAAHTAHHHPQCAPDETEGDVVQVGRVNFFILGDGINPDTEGMFF